MAQEAGMHSALVLTGATGPEALTRSPVVPDYVLAGVAEIVPVVRAARPATTATPGDRP
jgi:ribonucleotide monophosphatase NagD (HAD superfamily)